jgi:small subunit ribosomal protein S6
LFTYETVFITVPNLTEDEEKAAVAGLTQVVSDGGGVLVATDRMGRRRMAYTIKKFEDGIYTRFLYDSSPAVPKELERRLRISDKVLRHMTIRLEPDWAVASKEQWARDEKARAEAEAARAAGIIEPTATDAAAPPKDEAKSRRRDAEPEGDDIPEFGDEE